MTKSLKHIRKSTSVEEANSIKTLEVKRDMHHAKAKEYLGGEDGPVKDMTRAKKHLKAAETAHRLYKEKSLDLKDKLHEGEDYPTHIGKNKIKKTDYYYKKHNKPGEDDEYELRIHHLDDGSFFASTHKWEGEVPGGKVDHWVKKWGYQKEEIEPIEETGIAVDSSYSGSKFDVMHYRSSRQQTVTPKPGKDNTKHKATIRAHEVAIEKLEGKGGGLSADEHRQLIAHKKIVKTLIAGLDEEVVAEAKSKDEAGWKDPKAALMRKGYNKTGLKGTEFDGDIEKDMPSWMKKKSVKEENITEKWDGQKDPPPVILLKRKAIRVFPDGNRIALYHAQQLDKYISIPYGFGTATATVNERHMTPAEKSNREEIAQAIERDNPGISMEKKMKIATAQAMKEQFEMATMDLDEEYLPSLRETFEKLNDDNKQKFLDLLEEDHDKVIDFCLNIGTKDNG
jgi:hypothetical protein